MATCKECLHVEACSGFLPSDLDKDVWNYCSEGRADEIPDIDKRCSEFKDRSRFVEVVRCEKCIHGIDDGWICGGLAMMPCHPTFPDCYCNYGERKDNV